MGIKESFTELEQDTFEDREAVTNLDDAKINLTTQVEEQANNMVTKDAEMEKM